MTETATSDWENEISEFLGELSRVQGKLLALLEKKRSRIAAGDHTGLEGLAEEEQQLLEELKSVSERRSELLRAAASAGLPHDSIRGLTTSLPHGPRTRLNSDVVAARNRTRLLRHQSLANWVLVQRSLLHLSQMLEIIATGGRGAPTYEKGGRRPGGGSLIDQAV